jgi:hypothetical protein
VLLLSTNRVMCADDRGSATFDTKVIFEVRGYEDKSKGCLTPVILLLLSGILCRQSLRRYTIYRERERYSGLTVQFSPTVYVREGNNIQHHEPVTI